MAIVTIRRRGLRGLGDALAWNSGIQGQMQEWAATHGFPAGAPWDNWSYIYQQVTGVLGPQWDTIQPAVSRTDNLSLDAWLSTWLPGTVSAVHQAPSTGVSACGPQPISTGNLLDDQVKLAAWAMCVQSGGTQAVPGTGPAPTGGPGTTGTSGGGLVTQYPAAQPPVGTIAPPAPTGTSSLFSGTSGYLMLGAGALILFLMFRR